MERGKKGGPVSRIEEFHSHIKGGEEGLHRRRGGARLFVLSHGRSNRFLRNRGDVWLTKGGLPE